MIVSSGDPPQVTGRDGVPEPARASGTRLQRFVSWIRWPPPAHTEVLFRSRTTAAAYLAGWGLTVTHLVFWSLLALGVLHGQAWTITASVVAGTATLIFIVLIISTHRQAGRESRGLHREVLGAWWMGPWDPVGRQVWLPVRLGAGWRSLRRNV